MNLRWILGVLLLAASGCSVSVEFRAKPSGRVAKLPTTRRTLSVGEVQDARPLAEREGVGTSGYGYPYLVPLLVVDIWGWVNDWRGQIVSPDLEPEIVRPRVRQDLCEHLRQTGSFKEVVEGEGGDYHLDVELLHLTAAMHERGHGHQIVVLVYVVYTIIPVYVGWFSQEDTLPHATAALRLHLRKGGETVAERTVSNAVLMIPIPSDDSRENLRRASNRAVRGALAKARVQVASWVLSHEARGVSPKAAAARAEAQLAKSPSFLVARTNPHRMGTTFAKVAYPSGEVLRTWEKDGFSLGKPGEWQLSPVTGEGVQIPRAYYAALADRLSERFELRREDELSVYRYHGPRAKAR